jgi:hypothetical protein
LRRWYKTVARKNRESFLISFSSDLVFGGRSDIIQSHTINVRSILGAVDELYSRLQNRLQVLHSQKFSGNDKLIKALPRPFPGGLFCKFSCQF